MTEKLRPIRRVVTGNDAHGPSRVLFDSAAPNVNPRAVSASAAMTDIWVFHSCPAVISGERDDGKLPFHFEPPEKGGHLRIVQSAGRPRNYDPARDASAVPLRAAAKDRRDLGPRRTERLQFARPQVGDGGLR